MYRFMLCILTFIASLAACEKVEEKSKLCDFFGLDEKFCSQPLDVQDIIAQKLFNRFSYLFTDYVITEPIAQVKEHTCDVTSLLFINQGKTLISSSIDGHVVFSSIPDFKKIKEIRIDTPHKGNRYDANDGWIVYPICPCIVAVNEDESLLAVSTKRNADLENLATTITLINMQSGEIVRSFSTELCTGYLWFIPGKRLLVLPKPTIRQKWFEIIDLESGSVVRMPFIPAIPQVIHSAALSPDKSKFLMFDQNAFTFYSIKECTIETLKVIQCGAAISSDHLLFIDNSSFAYIADSFVIIVDDKKKCPEKNEHFIHLDYTKLPEFIWERHEEKITIGFHPPKPYFVASSYNEHSHQLLAAVSNRSCVLFDVEAQRKIAMYIDPAGLLTKGEDFESICILHPTLPLAVSVREVVWHKHTGNAERYIPLTFWTTSPVAYLLQNKACSIKQALFLILMHLIKKEIDTHHLKSFQLTHFPPDLRRECRFIFSRFEENQQRVIRRMLFATPSSAI